MENRILVEVTNDSEHTFQFDGDWFRAGDWKSEKTAQIPPQSLSVLEFQSTHMKGVAGVVWYTNAAEHDVYLSLVLANPRLQQPSFACFAGIPPADLKAELDLSPKLVKGERQAPEGAGCEWSAAAVGSLCVVKLTIHAQLERVPPRPAIVSKQASRRPDSANDEATQAAADAARDGGGGATSSSAAPAVDCTTLSATGQGATDLVAKEDQDEEWAKEAMTKMWVQSRPKDALDGIGKGLKTAGTSVVAGVGNVVASTVSGYGNEGAVGILKGFATGILGGAAIAVGGTACGVAQVARGVANTPEAMRGRRDQRVWDQELGQWVDIDLMALEQEVADEGSDDESPSGGSGAEPGDRQVVDTEYYDLMKVEPNASASQIKKAYYKEARSCHPDKCPGDSEAKAKFQKLADAYQVLSNPESRKRYDAEGRAGIEEGQMKMDPSVFFSLLFGSERFEPWVGELHLAMQTDQFAKALEKEAAERSAEETLQEGEAAARNLKRRQMHREVHCACHLREKLDRVVTERNSEGFEEQMRLEAVALGEGQFGPELLEKLGEIYQLRAEIYLADELCGRFSLTKRMASVKHGWHSTRHSVQLYSNMGSSLWRVKKMHDAARSSMSQPVAEKEKSGADRSPANSGGESPAASSSGAQRDAAQPAAQADEPEWQMEGDAKPAEAAGEAAETDKKEDEEVTETAREEMQKQALEDALDDALPMFLQTAWAAVVTDIDSTIKEVGRKLLKDKSVCWQIRVRRAQALQRLGQIFQEEGAKARDANGDTASRVMTSEAAKATLQEALVGSVREKK